MDQLHKPMNGLPIPQRYWAAAAVALGMMMSVMDSSVVNVALPTLAKELGVSDSASVWVVNSYNLSVLAFLLPSAALGERFGLQRVFKVGLVGFILGSFGFMFSNSLFEVCSFKVLQGMGGAAMMSMMGGLTRFNYPDHLFARGIGINAMVVAVSSMAGPLVSAAILTYFSWHWLAAINLPIGIAALIMSKNLGSVPRKVQKFDYASALLSALALCLFVYSIDSLFLHTARAILGLIAAVLFGYIVIKRAQNEATPLVPVDLMRIDVFRYAIYASCFSFAGSMSALVALPFHLHSVFGLTQQEVGYFLTVWPIGSGSMAMFAARLSEKYSASVLAGIGAVVMGVAMLCLALLPVTTPKVIILIFITFIGVGFGFFQMPNNKAMLSAAPKERSGAAGGAQATTRVFSQSIGAALVAFTLALPVEQPTTYALIGGFICSVMAALVNIRRYKKLS